MPEYSSEPYLHLVRSERDQLPLGALDIDEAAVPARFDWAIRHGHPHYYWPELPIHVWRACLYEIERCTAQVLAGTEDVELILPADAPPRGLGIAAFSAGMGALLSDWIQRGQVRASPTVASILALHLEHGRMRGRRLHAELLEFMALLAPAGIPVTVIKSSHTGTAYFGDAALRPAADIDVVLRRADLRRAADVLETAGYRATGRRHGISCDWLPPGVQPRVKSLELSHVDNGFTFDVHDSLDREFGGARTVRLGDVDRLTEPWPELAPNARRLKPVANVAALALHVSKEWHRLQLIRVVELVLVLRKDFGNNQAIWGDLEALLDRARAMRFTYPAFELVDRLVPGTVPPNFRRAVAQHAHERLVRVVDGLRPGAAQRIERLSLADALIWSDGAWQIIRRLLDLLIPIRLSRSGRSITAIHRERLYQLLRGRIEWR
jgi:hypothetical protein